jgi:hypothetical protein
VTRVGLAFAAAFYASCLLPSQTAATFTPFAAALSGISGARCGIPETVLTRLYVFFI